MLTKTGVALEGLKGFIIYLYSYSLEGTPFLADIRLLFHFQILQQYL